MMDMKEEMVSDTMDQAMDDGNTEEETDSVLNQVLEEVGIDMAGQLEAAPGASLAVPAAAAAAPADQQKQMAAADGLDDLESRLNNLKK